MFCLEIRFITGRYAAGRHDDPTRAEWPPHPARIFSALTAALHAGETEPAPDQREAMEWLARAGPPEIFAPPAEHRHLGNVFVPVNDSKALDGIDRNLLAVADAGAAVTATHGEARAKAEKTLQKEEQKLRDRSLATAEKSRMAPERAADLLDRPRHPRSFPVALPREDVVLVRWPADASEEIAHALDRLCGQVSRLGHSSSLVSMRPVDGDPEVPQGYCRWAPDAEGADFIRVPHDDQLRLLEDAYEIHKAVEPRVLPARSTRYSKSSGSPRTQDMPRSAFSASHREWIIYQVVPPPGESKRNLLDLSLTQKVMRSLRGTLLSAIGEPAATVVSGHEADGSPTTSPHAAFVPLADVGHRHASGSILGVAIVPPSDLDSRHGDQLLEAVFKSEQAALESGETGSDSLGRLRLTLGRSGVLHLERLREPSRVRTLDPMRWCAPASGARRWTTATAVALDRNPGNLLSRNPEEAERASQAAASSIADACVNIGLPEPVAVWIHRRSLLRGSPAARHFTPFPDGGNGPRRVCVHAEIEFAQPVRGPILLGAGRYFGLGVAMPYARRREEE